VPGFQLATERHGSPGKRAVSLTSIGSSEVEPAPAFGSDIRSEFISGVAKVGDRFVILLDVNHLLSMQELAALVG
jgi:chemotaxis signal transduction protein